MKVIIIYNPNSTGDSEANAKSLAKNLLAEGVGVTTRPTKYPKHGEEIAANLATKDEEVILISSSGDGGYHEVINGALAHPSKHLTVGVLPSGNANDHHSAMDTGDLVKAIRDKKFRSIDTIKVISTVKGKPWTRYAHSYVGIGVTANAAKKLTDERPNVFTEKWIVLKSLLSFRYSKLIESGKTRRYTSLLFGNIDTMSKVLKLSQNASVTDGKFEVSGIRFRSKLRLFIYLLTASTVGLKQSVSQSSYECRTTAPLPIQLDGEVYVLDGDAALLIESINKNLRCVL